MIEHQAICLPFWASRLNDSLNPEQWQSDVQGLPGPYVSVALDWRQSKVIGLCERVLVVLCSFKQCMMRTIVWHNWQIPNQLILVLAIQGRSGFVLRHGAWHFRVQG